MRNQPKSFLSCHGLAVIINILELWQRLVSIFVFKFNNWTIESIPPRVFVIFPEIRLEGIELNDLILSQQEPTQLCPLLCSVALVTLERPSKPLFFSFPPSPSNLYSLQVSEQQPSLIQRLVLHPE